jgi:hypothetical protein
MKTKAYLRISAAIFAVVALAHVVRVVLSLPVRAGDLALPMWVSWVGMFAAGGLSAWGFSSARRS